MLQFDRFELFPVEKHVDGDRECLIENMHYIVLVGGITPEERWVRIGEYDHVPQALDVFERLTGEQHPRHDAYLEAWKKRIGDAYMPMEVISEPKHKRPHLRVLPDAKCS